MAGASVVRPTRTVTGERRRWKKTKMTIRPSEPGIQGLKKEKKTLKCTCQKKNNYAYRQQETKQHLFAIRHISTSQGRRTNLASQGNNNTLFVLFFLLLSLYAIIGN